MAVLFALSAKTQGLAALKIAQSKLFLVTGLGVNTCDRLGAWLFIVTLTLH